MLRTILSLGLMLLSVASMALDIKNAKRINKSCALCHGVYGQGTPGTLSPRLAGLSADYLAKELEFYRSGRRDYLPMTVASSIERMSDNDIRDISEYLAGINLRNLNLPVIPKYDRGDKAEGEEEFMNECKTCHKKNGLGDLKKGIPPLAGQYGSYIFSQFKKFQSKDRYHDDDPEDETFDNYNEAELDNLIAFVTDLPPHEALAPTPTQFTLKMGGMAGINAKENKSLVKTIEEGNTDRIEWSKGALRISGHFRVTPTGEIVLNPSNQDLRAVAGTAGQFKVIEDGILFIPN